MFGISAFAQTSFASLAGNAYFATLSENIGMADTNSQTWTFGQTITENFGITDNNSEAGSILIFSTVSYTHLTLPTIYSV